jgi:excisionase family DNA binding protein
MSDEEKPDALLFDDKPVTPVIDPEVRAMIDEAREAAGEPAVTVRQAARALGLTREHVYARIRSGTIRAIDGPAGKGQGTVRLVPLSEIERLVVEQGPRAHGEVKPAPADSRPMLQLERVTQRLESTRAVLSEAVDAIAEPVAGGWWGRRQRERERMARLEAALRAAHAAADAGAPETATD